MSQRRQLSVIMFTDIVGYTALMGNDEQKAFDILSRNRQLQKPIIEAHNGKWVKELGDGVMASFSAVSDAVNAAVKIQEDCEIASDFQLRIGIHLGEVVLENDDLFGDGVNIAARIQAAAQPGSIYVSESVKQNLVNKKDISTRFILEAALKNVAEPVRLYEVLTKRSEKQEEQFPAVPTLTRTGESIAVLPFVNMSNDPDQDFFSDGLTEELISSLAKLKNVRVISRTTSMQYKNTQKDIKTIGKEIGVHYVVEGSVRKQANNLRITAQFLDALSDEHIWSETYRGSIDDIFDIQEMVSTKIVEALRIHLTTDEEQILQKRYTENTEAFQHYLRGIYFWQKRNEESLNSASKQFQKALELDPLYALAWAGLADTYSLMGEYTNVSRRELYPKQMAAVHKALELDNQLGEAHISLATALMLNEWDWKNSETEFKKGVALSPTYATGHHWYSQYLLFTGHFEKAYKEINLAVELDPVSQGILKDKGIHHYYSRQYDKAIEMGLLTLELDPSFVPAYRLLSLAYTGSGQYEAAIEQNDSWGRLTGNAGKADIALAQIYAAAGRSEEALQIINSKTEADHIGSNDYRGVALVYATLNDADAAFEWLDKSYDMHEESLCSLKVDPKLDSLRGDERFDALVDKIGV